MSSRRPVRSRLAALSFAVLCPPLFPLASSAQESPDTFAVREVVVTATRIPVPRAAVPAALTVLDGDALRARGVRSLADALREVPGASVVRTGAEGGLTSLFLRGGESDYVQVLVDGVVLNDPGGAVDLGQLTLDDVERIEVVRGPVSVLYGSDAVTGVVHVVTRRGAGTPRLGAVAEVGRAPRRNGDASVCPGYPASPCPEGSDLGAYTTRSLRADLSGGRGWLGYAFAASTYDSEGAYAFNNAYRNRSLSGRLHAGGEGTEAAVNVRYTDGRYRYPTDEAGRLVDDNVFRSSESLALSLDLARELSSRVELRALLSYHAGDYGVVDEPDSPADTLGFFASRSADHVDRRKADVHANVRVGGGTVLTGGLEVERQSGDSDYESRSEFGPYAAASANRRSNRAAYLQAWAAPVPALTLTAGARREDNDRFGAFLTWRGGVNLRFEGTTLRVSAGTAFKEPTFFENYAEGFARGNPGLSPEASRSWEVGVEQGFLGGRARLGATWFNQRFENLIQYTGQPGPGEPNYVNVGAASSRGVEVEGSVGSAGGPTLAANWVHLATRVLDAGRGTDPLFQPGEALIRRPRNRIGLTLTAPLGGRTLAGVSSRYVSAREDLDFLADPSGGRVTLPSHTVLDAFAEVGLIAGSEREVALRLRVENALGADYGEVANFPAAGRALFVGLRVGTGL